jgi:hypothetical protein
MPRLRRMSRSSIESLEQRIVPSVTMTRLDLDSDGSADDLKIVGGNEGTKIKITDEGVGPGSMLLDLDINGDGDFADVGDLQGVVLFVVDDTSVIDLQLGGGNDQVEYSLSQDLVTSSRKLSVDLGKGNDAFKFFGEGHLIGNGSVLDIHLLAGAGNDSLQASMPSVIQSTLSIDADLGAGNDVLLLRGHPSTTIDGTSVVDISIKLGAGTNSAQALMAFDVGVLTQADMRFEIIGGSGRDEVGILTDVDLGNGTLVSTFNVTAELGGGNDLLDHSIPRLDVNTGSVLSVRASGASGNDVLEVRYSLFRPTALKGVAQFDLLGGAGNDQLRSLFANNDGQLLLQRQLRVKMDGQDGNDRLESSLAVTAASTGDYSLVVLGGAGKDTFVVDLQTNGAALTYGLDGTLVIDGGQGIDQLQTTVPLNILEARLIENFV